MILSAITLGIQILATIFIPTLPDLPIRWHTLNYSCWNVFQLLVFANCASESSWADFLQNDYITDNCSDIQRMTLSIFMSCKFCEFQILFILETLLFSHSVTNPRWNLSALFPETRLHEVVQVLCLDSYLFLHGCRYFPRIR